MDEGKLAGKISADKVLDLIGAKYLLDTLKTVVPSEKAFVCSTGILGGVYALNNFDPIKDIPNGVYLTGFFSNYPTQKVVDEIFNFMNKNKLRPCVGKVFEFKNLRAALIAQDCGKVDGKIVVRV